MSRRRALGAAALAAGLLCGLWAGLLARTPAAVPALYTVGFATPASLASQDILRLEKEEAHFVLARQRTGQEAEAPLLDRRTSLSLLETWGDSALLFPFQALLWGDFPRQGDRFLAIDAKSAQELWGDGNALGRLLVIGGQEYVVGGVFESSYPVAVLPWDGTGSLAVNLCAFRPSATSGFPRQDLADFLSRLGLGGSSAVTGWQLRAHNIRQLCLLPFLLACMGLAGACIRRLLPGKGWLAGWGRRLAWLGAACCTVVALGLSPRIPEGALPTRWSDFSFWPERLDRFREGLTLRFSLPGTIPHLLFRDALLPAFLWGAGACLLVCIGLVLAREAK